MKFMLLNILTAGGFLMLIWTLAPPIMTEAVRSPLSLLVLFLALLTPLLERWLRPVGGSTSGGQVRKVMGVTMIKMFAMLGLILAYLLVGGPDPRVFGVSSYVVYLAFNSILVAESMRHSERPTDPR